MRWDATELLATPERVTAYLEEAFIDGDPALIVYSLGVAARSKGLSTQCYTLTYENADH